MGETLVAANEQQGYTLTDRATFLAMAARLPGLRLLVGGSRLSDNSDRSLRNVYGVMAVNPETHPGVNAVAATRFVEWILSVPTQRAIGDFGVTRFGQPLFYPDSDEFKASRQIGVTVAGRTVMLAVDELPLQAWAGTHEARSQQSELRGARPETHAASRCDSMPVTCVFLWLLATSSDIGGYSGFSGGLWRPTCCHRV
jgi:hypothetical protein